MSLYDGFFDATQNEETGEYDRTYGPDDFTGYFERIIGSGVCVHNNPDSFKVHMEDGQAVVSPGYLFIKGYWLRNDADYPIILPGTGNYAIVAHLNLGTRMIELEARTIETAYTDSLVLAIVSPSAAEDTRYNTDLCGVIDTAGELSAKVEWAVNYIDNEIESKLAAIEQDIAAQSAKLDAKIAAVQAVAESIVPPPIGTIKFSASQDVGKEWLRCDGSFVNEADYPELVAALGKLTPSADKFQLISDGEIGTRITNGALYNGRIWVYSYSDKKLYGVDSNGAEAVKEITVKSDEEAFGNFKEPSNVYPLCLSIVENLDKNGATLFLTQIIANGVNNRISKDKGWLSYFLIFSSDFTGDESELDMELPFTTLNAYGYSYSDSSLASTGTYFQHEYAIPYVVQCPDTSDQQYLTALGCHNGSALYLKWKKDSDPVTTAASGSFTASCYQRIIASKKSKNLIAFGSFDLFYSSGSYSVYSIPNDLYKATGTTSKSKIPSRADYCPANVVGKDLIVAYSLNDITSYPISNTASRKVNPNISLPSAARVFVDAAAYLWGKDVYLFFVGTGIIFSRDLTEGSFGYLDTTSVLGTITQFGYLDYSEDEGTVYLLGQDTANNVKVAKIVLNTLYDYANDGAWLPMIASDGVPAYIKAKEIK